jgi:GNAT superfamily N-acetyltransferase
MQEYRLTRLSESDIPGLIALSDQLGWDYAVPELQTALGAGIAFGHKTADGLLVSSAAIFPYGEQLASLGVVMVHSEHRRSGLGRTVTRRVLDWLEEESSFVPGQQIPVVLVATAMGRPLYETLGFHTVETLHKCLTDRYLAPEQPFTLLQGYELVPVSEEEATAEALFEQLVQLDAAAVGGDRRDFLRLRLQQAEQRFVLLQEGQPVGFGLGVQGPAYRVLGPIVAPDEATARSLVDTLARAKEGELRIDVPSCHDGLVTMLTKCGFEVVNQPPVMLYGAEALTRDLHRLYAIAAQAYG